MSFWWWDRASVWPTVLVFIEDGLWSSGLQAAGSADGAADGGHVCLRPGCPWLRPHRHVWTGRCKVLVPVSKNDITDDLWVEKGDGLVPGNPAVLLLPGEEPPSHVPSVERHLQQVSLKLNVPRRHADPQFGLMQLFSLHLVLILKTRSAWEYWWPCRLRNWPTESPTLVTCTPWPGRAVTWLPQETCRRPLQGWSRYGTPSCFLCLLMDSLLLLLVWSLKFCCLNIR